MSTEGVLSIGSLLLLASVIAAEIYWLVKSDWATSGRAVAFVLVTDVIGIGLGVVVIVIGFTLFLMMAFGHSGGGGVTSNAPFIAVIVVAMITPPVLLFFVKRIMLTVFNIKTGKTAWIYSLGTSILFTIIFILPPLIFYYFAYASSL